MMGCVIHLYYMFKQLEVTQIPCLVGDNTYVPVLHVLACKKFTAKSHSLGHHMRISKIICSSLSFISISLFLSLCDMLCSRFHFFFAFLFCFCCLLWVLTLKEVERIFKLERLFLLYQFIFQVIYDIQIIFVCFILMQITFELTVKQLMSFDPGEWTESLRKEYVLVIEGFFTVALPLFSGTYRRAIKVLCFS